VTYLGGSHRCLPYHRSSYCWFSPSTAPHCLVQVATSLIHTIAVQGNCPALPMRSTCSQVWLPQAGTNSDHLMERRSLKVTQKGNRLHQRPRSPHPAYTSLPAVLLSQALFLPFPNCLGIRKFFPGASAGEKTVSGGGVT
jgi:hypothetical protein